MNEVLAIKGLTKRYGKITAIDDLHLSVQKGSVYGILGPNGSGKTTTLGILLGVLNQDAGEYSWFGSKAIPSARKRIGALLETPVFYPYLSAVQNLEVVAKIKGIKTYDINRVLQLTGLYSRKEDPYKTFSLGMKQRLAIASALLGDPEVLVLDEPVNGLDPVGIVEVRDVINNVASQGVTILIASHLLSEIEKVCSHVAILRSGKLLTSGKMDEVIKDKNNLEEKFLELLK